MAAICCYCIIIYYKLNKLLQRLLSHSYKRFGNILDGWSGNNWMQECRWPSQSNLPFATAAAAESEPSEMGQEIPVLICSQALESLEGMRLSELLRASLMLPQTQISCSAQCIFILFVFCNVPLFLSNCTA